MSIFVPSKASRLTNLNGGALTQNGNSFYAGNPKIVYDASDFTRYKKLKAINKNFNDFFWSFKNFNTISFTAR